MRNILSHRSVASGGWSVANGAAFFFADRYFHPLVIADGTLLPPDLSAAVALIVMGWLIPPRCSMCRCGTAKSPRLVAPADDAIGARDVLIAALAGPLSVTYELDAMS